MLAAESGWNGPALQNTYHWVLSDQVRDMLVLGARPGDLGELIDRAVGD